jgi:hypothetical protein
MVTVGITECLDFVLRPVFRCSLECWRVDKVKNTSNPEKLYKCRKIVRSGNAGKLSGFTCKLKVTGGHRVLYKPT